MALTAKSLKDVRKTIPTNEITKGEMVRVNFNVSPETRSRWKIASIERGTNMQDLIIAAVEEYLKKSS